MTPSLGLDICVGTPLGHPLRSTGTEFPVGTRSGKVLVWKDYKSITTFNVDSMRHRIIRGS